MTKPSERPRRPAKDQSGLKGVFKEIGQGVLLIVGGLIVLGLFLSIFPPRID